MKPIKRLCLVFGLVGLLLPLGLSGQAPEPVVHAVLFYSPTCPHCHQVINETLIPLQNQYGNRLVLMGMDTSQQWASDLFYEAVRHYEVPETDWAVPLLIVGEEVLIGGNRIPARFPTIIEEALAGEGVDLPNYPALVTFLQEQEVLDPRYPDRLIARQAAPAEEDQPSAAGDSVVAEESPPPERPPVDTVTVDTATVDDSVPSEDSTENPATTDVAVVSDEGPTGSELNNPTGEEAPGGEMSDSLTPVQSPDSTPETAGGLGLENAVRELESRTMLDRFNMDKAGNSLSVLVLLLMIVSLALRGYPPRVKGGEWPFWVIPTLVLLGAGVAAYLTFIEVTQTEAVCGPVGDCNTVNQSKYAFLFGFLPVGVFGLMGYGTILVLWVLRRTGTGDLSRLSTLGLWSASLFGTLFSVYLTFLEPFVIGATCAWCLTSAIVMTLLLWATAPLAAQSWRTEEVTPGSS